MAQMTPEEARRVSFLSLFGSVGGDYDLAKEALDRMEDDGFFRTSGNGSSRSTGRNERSGGRGSGSRKSNSGSRGRGGGGNPDWRNDPITDKQYDKLLDLGADQDYSIEQLEGMTKGEASDLIEELS